jgi:hypothetical protein
MQKEAKAELARRDKEKRDNKKLRRLHHRPMSKDTSPKGKLSSIPPQGTKKVAFA